jgi:hypothetical protein
MSTPSEQTRSSHRSALHSQADAGSVGIVVRNKERERRFSFSLSSRMGKEEVFFFPTDDEKDFWLIIL